MLKTEHGEQRQREDSAESESRDAHGERWTMFHNVILDESVESSQLLFSQDGIAFRVLFMV